MLWQNPSRMFHHGTHFSSDIELASQLYELSAKARSLLKGWCALKPVSLWERLRATTLNQKRRKPKKSMMKKTSFAAILFALAMFVAAPLAQATTITEVQAMLTSLKAKTETVAISGKQADKDRAGLLAKLNEASLKVDQAKFCDAIAKLNDYKTSVNALIVVGRINQDPAAGTTGQELLNDADAIIAALNDLQVQSTGAPCSF